MPSASVFMENYSAYSVVVMTIELPFWFYKVESASQLIPGNKVNLRKVLANMTPDAWPVGVGMVERRHRERFYYDKPTM